MNFVRKLDIRRLANVLGETLHRENDLTTRVYSTLLNQESDIVPGLREKIIRWLWLLNQDFEYLPETFALAVNILDRVLSLVKAKSKYLRCIAITSYFLAIKLLEEDENIPPLQELVKVSECGCTESDVLRMERIIVTKLNWDLQNPTALTFLQLFHSQVFHHHANLLCDMAPSHHLQILTTKLEDCVCKHNFAQFKGSVLSLALLSEELESLSPSWLAMIINVQKVAQVDYGELIRCRELIAQAFIKDKRASASRGRILYKAPSLATIPECPEDSEVSFPGHLHKIMATSPVVLKPNSSATDSQSFTEELKRLHSIAIGIFGGEDSPIKTKRLKMEEHGQGSCGQQSRQSCGICTSGCLALQAIAL